MSRWLNLQLLLLCFISYIEISTVGNIPRSVTGGKGSSITLPCEFEDRNILDIVLSRFSKIVLVCENEECKSENGRVFKEGSCDVIIKDLIFSDAGRYILRVYYYNDQREVEPQILEYHLHIHDEISVKSGEELKMDVLLINADKVEKNSSGEWTEVWTRGHGVRRDRMNDSDGKLTINNFTVTDAGTYRVLDYEENILITVTVTGSSTGSKGKLNTDDDTDQQTVEPWIIGLSVNAALVLVLVISALIWKHQRQHRNTEHEPVPMYKQVYRSPEHLETALDTCNLPTDPQRIVNMYEYTHEH